MVEAGVRPAQLWSANGQSELGLIVRVNRIESDWAICTILTNRDFHQRHIDRCTYDHRADDPECGVRDRRGKTMQISLGSFSPAGQRYEQIHSGT